MIPYNAEELRMVTADNTRVVDDHIVHKLVAELLHQPKIEEGVYLLAY